MRTRRHFVVLTSAIAFGLLAPPGRAQPQPDPIVVGQVVDQSGLNGEASRDFVAGARVYFDHVNTQGGVNGHRIRLVVRDDGGEPDNTLAQTRELLDRENADVLFGYVGDPGIDGLLRSAVFKNAGIAFFGAASGLAVERGVANVYFTRASYAAEAEAIFDQFRPLGLKRYAIATANSPFHKAIAEEVKKLVRQKGLTLTGEVSLDTAGAGAAAAARTVFAAQPQVVIVLGDSITAALFIKAYRPIDAGGWVVGLSMLNPALISQMIGPDLAHALMMTQVVPSVSATLLPVALEHQAAMKRFRDEPPSQVTFEGYLAAKSLVQALRQVKGAPGRREIARALRTLPRLDLGGIRIQFADGNPHGSNYADIAFLRKDGTLLR